MTDNLCFLWFVLANGIWLYAINKLLKCINTKEKFNKKLANKWLVLIVLVLILEVLIIKTIKM